MLVLVQVRGQVLQLLMLPELEQGLQPLLQTKDNSSLFRCASARCMCESQSDRGMRVRLVPAQFEHWLVHGQRRTLW